MKHNVPTLVRTPAIVIILCCLLLNAAQSATLSGPANLSFAASDAHLNVDLSVNGDVYFEAGDFVGDFLLLNGAAGIRILGETDLWPHSGAAPFNLSDAQPITIDGDVRLASDASWDNSVGRVTSSGTIFVSGAALSVGEMHLETAGSITANGGQLNGTILSFNAGGTSLVITAVPGTFGTITFQSSSTAQVFIQGPDNDGGSQPPGAGVISLTAGNVGDAALSADGQPLHPEIVIVGGVSTGDPYGAGSAATLIISNSLTVPLPGSFILLGLGIAGLIRVAPRNLYRYTPNRLQ